MAKFNGTMFKLFVDASTDVEFDEQSELSIDVTVDSIDYTSKDSAGWAETGNGLRHWSGSCTIIVDWQEASKKQYKDIFTAITNRTNLSLIAKMSTEATGDVSLSGTAKIDSINLTAPMEDKVTASFNFTGSGALTLASAV